MFSRILCVAVLSFLTLTTLVLMSPKVEACLSMDCFCDSGGTTDERWGFGANCTEAEADLRDELDAILPAAVDATCAPFCMNQKRACDVWLHLSGCAYNPTKGMYQADGHYHFGCFACP